MCGKVLFEHHADLGPAPMLVYRATLSAVALSLWLNTSIKRTLWDDLDSKMLGPLATRVVAGNLSVFVNFMAVKYFKLTYVAMVINCAPLLTFFLAAAIFKEKVTKSQTINLLISFGGLMLMIFGGDQEDPRPEYTPGILAYIALLLNPVCMSAS